MDVEHIRLLSEADRALASPVLWFMCERLAPTSLSVSYTDLSHTVMHICAHKTQQYIYESTFAEVERLSEWVQTSYVCSSAADEMLVVVMSTDHHRRAPRDTTRAQPNLVRQEMALAALARVATEESDGTSK
jgi:hypothetical protein